MKLSFINEIADLCEAFGADIDDVVEGMGRDPRIGSAYLRPGIGFGGSCLPKELANLVRLGQLRGLPMHVFAGATRANDERPTRIVKRLEGITGGLHGRRVVILGLAFKAGTDDTRYSPAIALARELLARGAQVAAHDPAVERSATSSIAELERPSEVGTAVAGADLVVLATEWPQYRELDWADLAGRAREAVIFDGRNALDAGLLTRAGWRVFRVGSSSAGGGRPAVAEPLTNAG